MPLPDPLSRQPIPGWRGTAYLRAIVDDPRIEIGDFSYYDDSRGPEHFVARCVRYHFDFVGDRLIIGKFCAIAQGAQFLMNGANHPMRGISTFPFAAMGFVPGEAPDLDGDPPRGDTVIGNDVWIGREAVILPGVTIGDGAIIGAHAVVSRAVPPYAIVVGNPARVTRLRFSAGEIARLLAIRWWDWPVEKIMRHAALLRAADIDALENAE
ncbi:MAG: CatB-related O-acetyltransferase [Hyphomicrobiales bacterium]|uniref:CatB-related O-acetyltransferase n=1 Tax=Rhabdaerophilum calidifontis TaxID=2604328 RepID=UPI00123A3C11|nr:CatB-related O-acetyltransferase [Rhabdaerophilum calidifontis]MCA1952927.1 CatB-related O-acetyltransferase [Hyphomicrobiales bacterium]MCA1999578.1 CatB-related O-acetyltransferase [Hyphomicrobiales bacterium]